MEICHSISCSSHEPVAWWARYLTPVARSLSLVRLGTHPGGGVMGARRRYNAREK
jgi:hypothetical protein